MTPRTPARLLRRAARSLAFWAMALMLTGFSPTARASACPDREPEAAAVGPLPGGTGPADFGALPGACGFGDFTLRLRGTLLVARAKPDYYGNILAAALVRLQLPVTPESWFSVALDALDFRYVNRSGVAASSWSIGPPTVAYYRTFATTATSETAAYLRALLPLDTARKNGVETGVEAGATVRARLAPRMAVDGGLAVTTLVDVVAGQVHAHLQPVALAVAAYAPRPTLELAGGAALKAEIAPDPALLSVAPRLSGRWTSRRGLWLAALVELPAAGSDRTDLVASLFVGYRS